MSDGPKLTEPDFIEIDDKVAGVVIEEWAIGAGTWADMRAKNGVDWKPPVTWIMPQSFADVLIAKLPHLKARMRAAKPSALIVDTPIL